MSVILPVYNGGKYLCQAVESILSQTYRDIELICIDDGSTDGSLAVLESFNDIRMKVISRENRGLIATLNEGIQLAKYRYIARMDADDVSLPDRLEKQIKHMKRRRLAVVGSSYEYIDSDSVVLGRRVVPGSRVFTKYLLDFGASLCHPSVVFDRELLGEDLYYSKDAIACEDYELWLRLSNLGKPMGNVKEVLLRYRVLDSSISRMLSEKQKNGKVTLLLGESSYIKSFSDAEYMLGESGSGASIGLLRKLSLSISAFRCHGPLRALFVLTYLVIRR